MSTKKVIDARHTSARQLLDLQTRSAGCKEELAAAEKDEKKLRSQALIQGKQIKDADLRAARERVAGLNVDLEVFQDAITEQKTRFREALEDHRLNEQARLAQLGADCEEYREAALADLALLVARAAALEESISDSRSALTDWTQKEFSPTGIALNNYRAVFSTEKERFASELEQPTVAQIQQEMKRLSFWLNKYSGDKEFERILSEQRVSAVE